jgi:hypothetical protein
MKTIGLIRIENQKLIRSGISYKSKTIHANEIHKAWETRNNEKLLKILENWQFIIANLLKDGLFSYSIYEYFLSKTKSKQYYNCHMSDILIYLDNQKKFNLQFTKRINNCISKNLSIKEINKFKKDVFTGIVIDGKRVFPELYFPFIDNQYYNHFDWNKRIIGVALANFNDLRISNLTIYYTGLEKGVHGEINHHCNCQNETTSKTTVDGHELYAKKVLLSKEKYWAEFEKPLLFIGFTDKFTDEFNKPMKVDCWCSTNSPGQCGAGAIFATQACGKAKRDVNGQPKCSDNNHLCKDVESIHSYAY